MRSCPRPKSPLIVQSWDIASKEGPENDWSVCTTWLIFENRYYLVDVLRGRFDYPTLKGRVVSHAKRHKPNKKFSLKMSESGQRWSKILRLPHSQ